MISLELAQEFLYDKNTQILSHSHWVKEYKVTSVSIIHHSQNHFWVFFCEYWDCGLLQSAKVTTPISQFNSWLQERRENQITQLV